MKNLILLTIAILAVACGGDDQPAMGDAAKEIGTAFCTARVSCGFIPQADLSACIRHNVHHLCELEETCERPLTGEQVDTLAECINGFPAIACPLIRYGVVPGPCVPFL